MGGQKRQIPDGNSDAAKKKPAASERYERDQVASTSRRAEPAYPEDERAACRDQQRQRAPRYEERRYPAEMEPYNQYHGYYRQHPDWDTRRHRESAYRYPDHDDRSGRPYQRDFGWEYADGGGFNRNHGRPQYLGQQSDDRERQRRSPDQRETVREPHRNISRSGSSRGRPMQGSQEVSTGNRPISRSPGQGLNPPTRRVSNRNASNQPVPQPSSPGQSFSMGPPPAVVPTPAENQPVGQPSQNVPQGTSVKPKVKTGKKGKQSSQKTTRGPIIAEEDEKFINAVKMNPLLHNPLYKNTSCRKNAWNSLSKDLDIPVEQCQKKWRSLITKTKRYERKVAAGDTVSEEVKRFLNYTRFPHISHPPIQETQRLSQPELMSQLVHAKIQDLPLTRNRQFQAKLHKLCAKYI